MENPFLRTRLIERWVQRYKYRNKIIIRHFVVDSFLLCRACLSVQQFQKRPFKWWLILKSTLCTLRRWFIYDNVYITITLFYRKSQWTEVGLHGFDINQNGIIYFNWNQFVNDIIADIPENCCCLYSESCDVAFKGLCLQYQSRVFRPAGNWTLNSSWSS